MHVLVLFCRIGLVVCGVSGDTIVVALLCVFVRPNAPFEGLVELMCPRAFCVPKEILGHLCRYSVVA